MAPATLAADPRRRRQEGRRDRHGADRRHHGGQADARADPALPSAARSPRSPSTSSRTRRCPACASRATAKVAGADRRRDGGADRRLGRLPHHLRHGQGRRPRHGRSPASGWSRSAAASSGAVAAGRADVSAPSRRRRRSPASSPALAPVADRDDARSPRSPIGRDVLARRALASAARHAAALRRLGHGRLRRARRRCRAPAGAA